MKLNNNYKTKRPLFKFIRTILKMIITEPTIIDENTSLEEPVIFISNHSAASGPMKLSAYFKYEFRPWGASPMCGNFKERFNYLYFVFYGQKLGYAKLKRFLLALLLGTISGYLYRNMRLIPTFNTLGLMHTLNESIKELENGGNIFIFPEDSSEGYLSFLTHYFTGFVNLNKIYFNKHGKYLPIVPIYYNSSQNIVHVMQQTDMGLLVKQGLTTKQIAEHYKNITNDMAKKYIDCSDLINN